MKHNFIAAFSAIFLASALSFAIASTPERDKLLGELRAKPFRVFENYAFDPKSSLASRIGLPPAFLLKALRDNDERFDYAGFALSAAQKKQVEEYLALLPAATREALQQKCLGIYFVHNFWGGGFTDFAVDKKGELYYYLVFNSGSLQISVNDWLSSKEESGFDFDDLSVNVRVECGKAGNEKPGFLYVLFHETAHVVDYVKDRTPYVENDTQILNESKVQETPFTKNIWKELRLPVPGADFANRTNISSYGFHGKPKIKSSEAEKFYRDLAKTPFASAYASGSWAEDFADTTGLLLLTKALKEDLTLTVLKNKKAVFSYQPLKTDKVKERLRLLDP